MSAELEQVKKIIESSRNEHSLLASEVFSGGDFEFAREILASVSGEKAVNAAAALEFVSLGVRYHYLNSNLDSRNLIFGDYFYARALKQISQNNDPEQVKILAQAVMDISAVGGRGFKKILLNAARLLTERLNLIK